MWLVHIKTADVGDTTSAAVDSNPTDLNLEKNGCYTATQVGLTLS